MLTSDSIGATSCGQTSFNHFNELIEGVNIIMQHDVIVWNEYPRVKVLYAVVIRVALYCFIATVILCPFANLTQLNLNNL